MTDWTQPAAYEKPRKRKAKKKRKANGGWFESAVLLAAFCLGFG